MLVTYITKIASFPSFMQIGNEANLRVARQGISCSIHDKQSCGSNHAHILELSYLTKFEREKLWEETRMHKMDS